MNVKSRARIILGLAVAVTLLGLAPAYPACWRSCYNVLFDCGGGVTMFGGWCVLTYVCDYSCVSDAGALCGQECYDYWSINCLCYWT